MLSCGKFGTVSAPTCGLFKDTPVASDCKCMTQINLNVSKLILVAFYKWLYSASTSRLKLFVADATCSSSATRGNQIQLLPALPCQFCPLAMLEC
eukprot:3301464-Rhodomonas_salina.1